MEEIGYTQCPEYAIFRIGTWKRDDWAVCAFWVDNETGIGARCQPDRVLDMLRKKYGISGEGELRWMLEIGVKRDFDTHIISFLQESYINNFMERFGLHGARPIATPLPPGAILTKDDPPKTPKEIEDTNENRYRELIGSLHYVALATRPGVAFAVSKHSVPCKPRPRAPRGSYTRITIPEMNQGVYPQSRWRCSRHRWVFRFRLGWRSWCTYSGWVREPFHGKRRNEHPSHFHLLKLSIWRWGDPMEILMLHSASSWSASMVPSLRKGTCGPPSAVSTHAGNAKTDTVSHTLVRVDIRPGRGHASAVGPIEHPLLPQDPIILERMTESTVGDIVISLVRLCLPI